MSTTARHISPATIRATHRLNGRAARRRAVVRFRTVWAARVERWAVALTVLSGAVGAGVFLAVGYALRLWQMGAL